MKSLLRIVLLTACAWTCVFSQTKIYPTQSRGFSAVTATSSAITMAPGGIWAPGVEFEHMHPAAAACLWMDELTPGARAETHRGHRGRARATREAHDRGA